MFCALPDILPPGSFPFNPSSRVIYKFFPYCVKEITRSNWHLRPSGLHHPMWPIKNFSWQPRRLGTISEGLFCCFKLIRGPSLSYHLIVCRFRLICIFFLVVDCVVLDMIPSLLDVSRGKLSKIVRDKDQGQKRKFL